MSGYCGLQQSGVYTSQRKSKPCDTLAMWLFTIVIIMGLIFTLLNIRGYCAISCYEGVIITALGVLFSIITGVKSNTKLYKVYLAK